MKIHRTKLSKSSQQTPIEKHTKTDEKRRTWSEETEMRKRLMNVGEKGGHEVC